jgi:hypothetical protein
MRTLNDRELRSPEHNLEIGTDKPNVRLILRELEETETSMQWYLNRNAGAREMWQARWAGQFADGRKHPLEEGGECFPFDGAADTRVRTIEEQISDHVTVQRFAWTKAKIQAETSRTFAPGMARESGQVSKILKWQFRTAMRAELQREIPLALHWRNGYGAAFLEVSWKQTRRLEFHELNTTTLTDLIQFKYQIPTWLEAQAQLNDALTDPALFDGLVDFVRGLSPLLNLARAQKAVEELQAFRTTDIPVPEIFESRPQWMARRPGVDILLRDLTGDVQQEPWVDFLEWVSETDLYDRIATQDYDPRFVREAIKQKGEGSDDSWVGTTLAERGTYGGYNQRPAWVNSRANQILLHHFFYKARREGVPCLYKTIFNRATVGDDLKNPLVAWHGKHPYDHGQYPLVPLRFETVDRPITSSIGIAEKAYTWQQDIKRQLDAMGDRASIVNRPPMVVPLNRLGYYRNEYGPGALMGAQRPGEINWPPLPPTDSTPIELLKLAAQMVQSFFGLFGVELDPIRKSMRQAQVAGDFTEEMTVAGQMTLALDQQYLGDQEAEEVSGPLAMPFKINPEEIRAAHRVTVTFDVTMLDEEKVQKKIGMVSELVGAFNQNGRAKTDDLLEVGMDLIDTDLADRVLDTNEGATDRERNDELNAISRAFQGLESPLPAHANHQLRLDTIMQNTVQSQNPYMKERLAKAGPDTLEILKKRAEFHENQIQQYQENPQIGRTLGTRPFSSKAPQLAATTS